MQKKVLFVVLAFACTIILSFGCSNPIGTNPVSPTATPAVSPTATPLTSSSGVNISVAAQMMDNNGVIGITQFVVYAADNSGATLNVSAVTLTAPGGSLSGTINSGVFSYSAYNLTNYVPSGTYTVSVTYNATTYTGTFSLPADMTISSDGNTVTWPAGANTALITVITPAMSSVIYGPYISSPYDLSSTYTTYGAGQYSVSSTVTHINLFTPNNGAAGIVVSQQAKIKILTK